MVAQVDVFSAVEEMAVADGVHDRLLHRPTGGILSRQTTKRDVGIDDLFAFAIHDDRDRYMAGEGKLPPLRHRWPPIHRQAAADTVSRSRRVSRRPEQRG